MSKKFIGYTIIGASNKEDAKAQKGLMMWSEVKPMWFYRKMQKLFFNIFWIDEEKIVENKKPGNLQNKDTKSEIPKFKQ